MACSLDANIAFNNNLFSPATIALVKVEHEPAGSPSSRRLLEAAKSRGVDGPAALARKLDQLDQTITNWGSRGVSKQGALKAQEKLEISAAWILTGLGPCFLGDDAATPAAAGSSTVRSIQTAPSSPYAVVTSLASMLSKLDEDDREHAAIMLGKLATNPADEARISKLARLLGGAAEQQAERGVRASK